MINIFDDDLAYSIENNSDKEINAFYKRHFKNLKRIEEITDKETQKTGVDKILHFESGKKVLIDEKKRRKDYGDILLEEYSSFESKTPSWLSDEKRTDYIAYIIMPIKKIYLLPFLLLCKTWQRNYIDWLKKYGRILAPNLGYNTSNVPVPTKVLIRAINQEMCLTFRIKQKLVNLLSFFKN